MAVLWLRLHTLKTGYMGLIPGQGTRSHGAAYKTNKKTKQIKSTKGWGILANLTSQALLKAGQVRGIRHLIRY